MSLAEITLDDAGDRFDAEPTAQAAADLITVAMQYWSDDMIGDETFAHKVTLVRDWLRADGDRS